MVPSIDLVLLVPDLEVQSGQWPLGKVYACRPAPAAVQQVISEGLSASRADAWLFWDSGSELPRTDQLSEMLRGPADVWHSGLGLGMRGLPWLMDFVNPTWMLNRDPDAGIEATSWRLSLRACLVRTRILRELGAVRPEFISLDGAALELGHRYITRGALVRHMPSLAPVGHTASSVHIPLEDELRFVYYRHGERWSAWTLARAVASGYAGPVDAARAWRLVLRATRPPEPDPLSRDSTPTLTPIAAEVSRVSVLVPTVDRYPYLRTLLAQLRTQTVRVCEIIIVDQTPVERRDTSIEHDFADLHVKLLHMDQAGQCSSRNLGLQAVSGDYILLADDDIEIPSTFIEQHLGVLARSGIDVCSGVAEEVGAGSLPSNFQYSRVSDVFPAGNTMMAKRVLEKSGLFDLAYDHGQRADGDLGMRVYLSGTLMLLEPAISVLHHHAPRGGLRAHKARVITYASSRQSLRQRHLPSATEIYLMMRYFTPRQVRERLWLHVLGTFSARGGPLKRLTKAVLAVIYLPDSLRQMRKRYREARQMLRRFPQIPEFAPSRAYEQEPGRSYSQEACQL